MVSDLEATLPLTISQRGEVIIVTWHVLPVGGQRTMVDDRYRGRRVEHHVPN